MYKMISSHNVLSALRKEDNVTAISNQSSEWRLSELVVDTEKQILD